MNVDEYDAQAAPLYRLDRAQMGVGDRHRTDRGVSDLVDAQRGVRPGG